MVRYVGMMGDMPSPEPEKGDLIRASSKITPRRRAKTPEEAAASLDDEDVRPPGPPLDGFR